MKLTDERFLEKISISNQVALVRTTFWKLRAGNYRLIYEIEPKPDRVMILYIGHRKHVYDEFQRLL